MALEKWKVRLRYEDQNSPSHQYHLQPSEARDDLYIETMAADFAPPKRPRG